MEIYVGVIRHKHGYDLKLASTEEGLYDEVYGYIKEWWGDFGDGAPLPEDHLTAISAYFELAGDQEGLDIIPCELRLSTH
jgi:hypothetical protein